MGGSDLSSLDDQWKDRLIAIGKGVAGAIPFVGGVVGELVGMIPGQRADRIAAYLAGLSNRVDALDADVRATLANSPEKLDLIEEGGVQASRATSAARIEQIVEAVSRGLDEDESDLVRRKRLLRLVGELDDDEVNLLNAYGRSFGGGDRQAFERVNQPDPLHLQSSMEARDENVLYDAGRAHLLRLGLLKKNYGSLKRGATPEFDPNSGDFKHRLEVSTLGRMMLREIGLETPFDVAQRSGG
jgi:hypothetical protein